MAPYIDSMPLSSADDALDRVSAVINAPKIRTLKVPGPLKGLPIIDLLERLRLEDTVQLTSFGPTGMVLIDMFDKLGILSQMRIVFIDTLFQFPQTLQLIERTKEPYPNLNLTIYKPTGCETREEFESKYGADLWKDDPDYFGYLTKAEPRDRALREMNATIYINGRRADQGDLRSNLSLVEYDPAIGAVQIQPLFDWTYDHVMGYLRRFDVPKNALLDMGYKSVGDIMTTIPVPKDAPERSGRFQGLGKTECGLHVGPRRVGIAV